MQVLISLETHSDSEKRSRDEIFVQQEVKARSMVTRRVPLHPEPKPPSRKKPRKEATTDSTAEAPDNPVMDTPEEQDKVDPVRLIRSPITEDTAVKDADTP